MFESIAYAAPVTSAAGTAPANEVNPLLNFLPLGLIFVIFYFFLIRPQQKRQQETQKMADALKKGDRVVTIGGMIGTVASIQNDYVVLKIGEGETKIEVLKSAISGLRSDKG